MSHINYREPNRNQERQLTSRSALTFHTPYPTASIPMKAIKVFVRQFAGRDHQPPVFESFRAEENGSA